ncbi:unnamed protein product [Lathyrus sativus]|nr:unnamed protein product [Lathyrus sativus]
MYMKDTYQASYRPVIYPTNSENLWEETLYPNILPPPLRRATERSKRRRNKDIYEKRKDTTTISRKELSNKCSMCGKSGHNKSSCPTSSTSRQLEQSQTQPIQP